MTSAPHADSLDQTYPGTTDALNDARGAAAAVTSDWGERQDTVERVKLVVSELTANAVEASPGEPYRLRLDRSGDGRISIRVTNHAGTEDLPPATDWGPSEALAARGRGLGIVQALSDQVEYEQLSGHRLQVTAVLTA